MAAEIPMILRSPLVVIHTQAVALAMEVLPQMSEGVKVISVAAFHNAAIWKRKAKYHIKAD